jgi:flagellar hook-associated protein 1 FlgK
MPPTRLQSPRDAVLTNSLTAPREFHPAGPGSGAFCAEHRGTSTSSGQHTLLNGLSNLKNILGGNDYETSPRPCSQQCATPWRPMQPSPVKRRWLRPRSRMRLPWPVCGMLPRPSRPSDMMPTRKSSRQVAAQRVAWPLRNGQQQCLQRHPSGTGCQCRTRRARFVAQADHLDCRGHAGHPVGNDMALYTSDGVTLFETVARPVEFDTSVGLLGHDDRAIRSMSTVSRCLPVRAQPPPPKGSLQSLLQIRDDIAPSTADPAR